MRIQSFAASFFLAGALVSGCATATKNSEAGFVSLFDGKTLNGWIYAEDKALGYIVKNGELICTEGTTNDLFTIKEYSDFILRLEYKLKPGGNNGIGIRSQLERGQIAYIGTEVQILDDDAPKHAKIKPWQACGAVYGITNPKPNSNKKPGQWNTMEISAIGRKIKVTINDMVVSEANINEVTDPDIIQKHPGLFRERGHIGLLAHRDEVAFRNIRIKELPTPPTTGPLARHNSAPPEGFKSLFNGHDLSGWRGLVGNPITRKKMSLEEWAREQIKADELMRKNWRVENGNLIYRGNGFDNLCTVDYFGNFELLVDWKVPEKGDSGIYLRGFPQVQIWEPNSAGFDRAHPGSGGLYNNKKSPSYPAQFADHFLGEWNRFRIIMASDKVHVFLNSQLVVNNVTLENFFDREKPVDAIGPIELQAHRDPVQFRNIYVREIPRVETR